MGLPGHRRTSSHKRRRASHFALKPVILAVDKKTGATHLSHKAAPGATEYRGITIHVKGQKRKLEKALAKTKAKMTHEHGHDHAGHDHAAPAASTKAAKTPVKKTVRKPSV